MPNTWKSVEVEANDINQIDDCHSNNEEANADLDREKPRHIQKNLDPLGSFLDPRMGEEIDILSECRSNQFSGREKSSGLGRGQLIEEYVQNTKVKRLREQLRMVLCIPENYNPVKGLDKNSGSDPDYRCPSQELKAKFRNSTLGNGYRVPPPHPPNQKDTAFLDELDRILPELNLSRSLGFGNDMIESYFMNHEEDMKKPTTAKPVATKATTASQDTLIIGRRKKNAKNVLISSLLEKINNQEGDEDSKNREKTVIIGEKTELSGNNLCHNIEESVKCYHSVEEENLL